MSFRNISEGHFVILSLVSYNQLIDIYKNQLESIDGIAYYNNQFNNCIEKIEIIKEKVLDVSPNTSLSSRLKP